MIEFVFASAAMLTDLASWIAVGLLAWILAGICVAIPLAHRLGQESEQYPPADTTEEPTP